MTFKLRDYQEHAVQAGVGAMQSEKRKNSIVVVPTGGGKSLVISSIANELPGKTLILQPSKEILEQNLAKTMAFGETDIGVYSASFGMKKIRKITFATIGSIHKKPELFADFERVIMDECHGVNANEGMYRSFFETTSLPILGLTATPYRLHPKNSFHGATIKFINRTRPRIFTDIVHITQNRDLYARGYLSPNDYITVSIDRGGAQLLRLNSTGADFTDESIRAYHSAIGLTEKIKAYIQATTTKHILVFCSFISEAQALVTELDRIGITARFVTGETPMSVRSRILDDFKAGQIRVVANVGVLTTGFDFPALDSIVCARPTNSLALYYQMAGRGARLSPGKTHCEFVDIGGNVERFGRLEDFEIVTNDNGTHRMKSGKGFLTGVCLETGRDLEAPKDPQKKIDNSSSPPNSGKIGFGKYKGQDVKTVPAHYLKWLVENFSPGSARSMAEEELQRRVSLGMGSVA
jgi:DNA repair protein RadD